MKAHATLAVVALAVVALAVVALAMTLGGCASFSVNRNLEETQRFSRENFSAELRWLNSEDERRSAQAEVQRLLKQPLTSEDAVRVALAYSPSFQIVLAEDAATSARTTQTGRLANPVFTFEKLVRTEDGVRDLDIGRKLTLSLVDLVLLPARAGRADLQQQRLRMQSAAQVVRTVTETRQAWVRAVASEQSVVYARQVMQAAQAGAELARRMQAAGNFSRLQRAREQAFYAEAAAQVSRAQQQAVDSREALIRLLGLESAQATSLKLPDRLPDLPASARDEADFMRQALSERIDLRQAKFDLEQEAKTRGLSRIETYVDGLQVSAINNSTSGKPQQRGYEIEFPLPIFDFGGPSRAAAQAQYMAAFYRTAQVAVDAASQVRQQYAAYRGALDLATHYRDEIIPLRKAISDEMQLKYNGMLEGVFELLADSREQIGSVVSAIDAQRDYWLAEANLKAVTLGSPIGASPASGGAKSGDD